MVQCVNLAADSRRKPRGIAGRAHFQVHATDLIAQVSAIGLGQWDIEARPCSVAIAAKPAVPEDVQHGLITSRIQLVHHAQVRWAVNVGCPVEVASGVADHSVRVGSSGPAREAVQYRLLAGRIQLVHHAKARCPPPLVSGARTPWSARVPWTRSFVRRTKAFANRDRPTRASAAVQGDRTTISAGARLQEKYAALHTSACATSSPSGARWSPRAGGGGW